MNKGKNGGKLMMKEERSKGKKLNGKEWKQKGKLGRNYERGKHPVTLYFNILFPLLTNH